MTRFLGLIALVAMVLFAVPASAQQEQDTSAIGRQGEGVPTGDVGTPQAPSDEGLTTRQGIETEQAAGEAGQVAEEPSQPGVTQRAAEEGVRADEYGATPSETETGVAPSETETGVAPSETTTPSEVGGEMPTTASDLPLALVAGVILMAAGLGLRFAAGRR